MRTRIAGLLPRVPRIGKGASRGPRRPVDAQARIRSRTRRARIWLTAAQVVHGSTFVFVVLVLVAGSVPTGAAVVAGVLVAVAPVLLARWERRAPSRGRPAIWPRRGLAIVLPHAAAFGIAAGARSEPTSLPWSQVLLFAAALMVVEGGAICLASRALRFPLTPEIGEMDVEVLVRIRPVATWLPAWLSNDDVRMTGDALVVTVRPSPTCAYATRIALADVTDVAVRPTGDREEPWLVVDGHRLWPPAGEAVVIIRRSGATMLPVHRPGAFAEVVRARIEALGRMRTAG